MEKWGGASCTCRLFHSSKRVRRTKFFRSTDNLQERKGEKSSGSTKRGAESGEKTDTRRAGCPNPIGFPGVRILVLCSSCIVRRSRVTSRE